MKDVLGRRATLLSEAEQIVAKDELASEDVERIDQIMAEVDDLNKIIEAKSRVLTALEESRRSMGILTAPEQPKAEAGGAGWKNFGEFIRAVCIPEYRQGPPPQEMSTGAAGGYLVPDEFRDVLLETAYQNAIIRPRATVIPASSDHPDAAVEIPVIDYSAGRYGGVQVTWIAEGDIKHETEVNFELVKLAPKEVAAYIPITEKLLRNAPQIGDICMNMMARAIRAAEDDAFLNSAVGGPLGILDAMCVNQPTLYIPRAGADAIAYADVVNMLSRALPGGNYVWVASPTTIPELTTMAGMLGQTAFQFSQGAAVPDRLLGYPIIFNERSPVLGEEGDLCLLDLSYYIIKDGYGPAVLSDEGKYMFPYNMVYLKAFWNVDGQPWLRTVITLEDGATTVSPFVVLDDDVAGGS